MKQNELEAKVALELESCSDAQRHLFNAARVTFERWSLSAWGDTDGGFWVVAVRGDRVLWFNHIEDGFQVSCFVERGRIPADEYGCNQDELRWALRKLEGDLGMRLGGPLPIPYE